jgi:hypothetical protein
MTFAPPMYWYRSEESGPAVTEIYYVYIQAHSAADALACLKHAGYQVRKLECAHRPPEWCHTRRPFNWRGDFDSKLAEPAELKVTEVIRPKRRWQEAKARNLERMADSRGERVGKGLGAATEAQEERAALREIAREAIAAKRKREE